MSVVTATTLLPAMVPLTAQAQAQTAAAPITWENCPAEKLDRPGARCGHIEVPENYANPGGKKITVGFIQFPNANAEVVFTNPGGPGGGVYEWLGKKNGTRLPQA